MEQTKENKMGVMPVNKLLVTMSLPIVISMLIQAMYNLVDSVFVAQINPDALTAVGMAFPMQSLMIAFQTGLGVGMNALVSRYLGQKKPYEAGLAATHALILTALNYVVFLIVGLTAIPAFFSIQTHSEIIAGYGVEYLSIVCCGSLGLFFQIYGERILQATGKTLLSMVSQILGAVINIVLDPVFIFVFGWGIKGAAWATVIGQVVSGVLVIVYFWKFRNMYLTGAMLKPKMPYLKAIISLGLASCINQIAMAIVQIVLNNILRHYGADSVYGSDIPIACVGIVSKVNMVFMAICIGISQGSQPIWGFNYGAKKYDRVRQAYRYSVTACTVIATIFFFCFQIFPHQIVGIFGTGSDLYFQFAERYLKIFMFMTFANGIQPVSSGFFTSIGMAKLGIVMSLTRQVIFLLPLIIIFPLFMGIDGVMYAGPIADAAAFVLAIVFARRELGKMRSAEIV